MKQRLLRAIAVTMLAAWPIGPVFAQPPSAPAEPVATLAPSTTAEKAGPNPTPAYVATFLSTLLILFIVCKPSRKI